MTVDNENCQSPLVTAILVTYNQELVVEEAVRSVFAQDYEPLEIILSDDCSTDSTFGVLQKMASDYVGPHQVRINKNSINLGIGKHWDSISRQASGGLIVHFAGDDVSIPSRVATMVDAWMSVDPRPSLISSDGMIITYEGDPIGRHIGARWPDKVQIQREPRTFNLDLVDIPVCGFSLAIDRNLYEEFDSIEDRLWAEDVMLRRRALLLQGIMYIPDVLVFYRDQGLSKGARKTQQAYIELFLAHADTRLSLIHQSMRDVDKIAPPTSARDYFKILERQEVTAKRRFQLINGGFSTSLIALFRLIVGSDREGVHRNEYVSFFSVRWVPKFFFWLRGKKVRLMEYIR